MSLVKNSLLYIISTLSVKAASFLLLPFYSYLVTPAEYGYVFVVSAFVSFMSIFMAFSLHGALSRFYLYLANLHTSFLCNLIYPTFSRILLYSC